MNARYRELAAECGRNALIASTVIQREALENEQRLWLGLAKRHEFMQVRFNEELK